MEMTLEMYQMLGEIENAAMDSAVDVELYIEDYWLNGRREDGFPTIEDIESFTDYAFDIAESREPANEEDTERIERLRIIRDMNFQVGYLVREASMAGIGGERINKALEPAKRVFWEDIDKTLSRMKLLGLRK